MIFFADELSLYVPGMTVNSFIIRQYRIGYLTTHGTTFEKNADVPVFGEILLKTAGRTVVRYESETIRYSHRGSPMRQPQKR
jgi:hypothetical protein